MRMTRGSDDDVLHIELGQLLPILIQDAYKEVKCMAAVAMMAQTEARLLASNSQVRDAGETCRYTAPSWKRPSTLIFSSVWYWPKFCLPDCSTLTAPVDANYSILR